MVSVVVIVPVAGAAIVVSIGATGATISVAGATVSVLTVVFSSVLLVQEAANTAKDRARALSFTNVIILVLKIDLNCCLSAKQ